MASLRHLLLHEQRLYYSPEFPDCSILRCISFPPPIPPPPPVPPPVHKNLLANHALLASTVLVAFFLISILSSAFFLFFHRLCRRRRAARLLRIHSPSFPDVGLDLNDEPVHHVWYIRTVGLDEADIASIQVREFRKEDGLVTAADCAVCLGDFVDGDLVRLLPKCGHAFHVPCIDTWLRAHVNCPLCRAHVIDPVVGNTVGNVELRDEGENLETGSEESSERSGSNEVGLEREMRNEEGIESEQEVFVEIPLSDEESDDENPSDSVVETEERESRPVRYRSASVDSPFVDPSVVVSIPEIGTGTDTGTGTGTGEQSCKEMEKVVTQTGQSGMERSLSSSSSNRVFFFSRNGRSRSSVLPL